MKPLDIVNLLQQQFEADSSTFQEIAVPLLLEVEMEGGALERYICDARGLRFDDRVGVASSNLRLAAKDFVSWYTEGVTFQELFLEGRLRASGDWRHLLKFGVLLDALRSRDCPR